jgi:transcriptional regulator with XRE-family HTH domain
MYPMPKINPNPHPVAVARKALGWTQARLAEKCGCAAVTIKKIEGRTLKPSSSMAARIMWVTGLSPSCIISDTTATFAELAPYSAELGRAHVEAMATKSKTGDVQLGKFEEERISAWGRVFTAVIVAAAYRNALRPVGHLFEEWVLSIVDDFRLGSEFRKAAAPQGSLLERLQKDSRRKGKSKN